jgi:hypothetical protein
LACRFLFLLVKPYRMGSLFLLQVATIPLKKNWMNTL